MRYVVREGQKTWYGLTKKEWIARIHALRRRTYGMGCGDAEIAARDQERIDFIEYQLDRMADT